MQCYKTLNWYGINSKSKILFLGEHLLKLSDAVLRGDDMDCRNLEFHKTNVSEKKRDPLV